MTKEELMRKAIELSVKNVAEGGGPFGAVIARNGEIVATGVNRVTDEHDPTAHAEVSAIRAACRKLNTFDLSGCEIYTSCEPCPMCLGAIYWAHLDRMYYGNNRRVHLRGDSAEARRPQACIHETASRGGHQGVRGLEAQGRQGRVLEAFRRFPEVRRNCRLCSPETRFEAASPSGFRS